jgi:hypothetical protein
MKKSNDKSFLCFRPFRIGKISDKDFLIQTLVYVLFQHIFVSVTSFKGTPKSMGIFYNVSLLTDRLCGLVVRVPAYRSRGLGFDFRSYQIFLDVVGLEQGPLRVVSTIEGLLGRNSSGFGLENGRGDPLRCPRYTLYPQKLALTSPTGGSRSLAD